VKIDYSMDIMAPIERAFEYISEHEKQILWMDGLVDVVYDQPLDRKNPVGTKFRHRIREAAHITDYNGEILVYDKPNLMVVCIGNSMFSVEVNYSLVRLEKGTRLDYSANIITGLPFTSIMSRLFTLFTKRVLERQMRKLRELTEKSA
jgi:hypothetical protein